MNRWLFFLKIKIGALICIWEYFFEMDWTKNLFALFMIIFNIARTFQGILSSKESVNNFDGLW